jgi:hypothetical protein
MAFVLLGAVAVAVFAACIAFIIQRSFRINARWIIPAGAGAGMLFFTIYNDYTWFGRTSGALPPGFVVTQSFTRSNAIQPWSLLTPITERFVAVDLGGLQVNEARPSVRRALVHFVARFQPTLSSVQLFDCETLRRADAAAPGVGADGLPPESEWFPFDPADPLLRAVCDAPAPG